MRYDSAMSSPTPFDRCHDHQATALASISLAKSLIETPFDSYDAAAMAALRTELSETLSTYQVLKHEGIFNPAIMGGDPARAAVARTMKIACIAAGEEFRHYVATWAPVSGHDHWAEYRLSTLTMIKHLREHLDTERSALDALAAMPVMA